MKETRSQMRELLESDEDKILHDTWYEYSDDKPLPTDDRADLIESILDLMEKEGHIQSESKTFTLPDLARSLGVDPKVARDKLRRAIRKGIAPDSLKPTGWVFNISDQDLISGIIELKRNK